MTESCGVELGPLPLPDSGLGGRNQIEACDVAEISRLGAPRRRRLLHRIAWRDHDAGQFGTCRRHPRRTQTADEVQMGRLPAGLQGLGHGRRHRHRGQPQGVRRIRQGRQLGGATIVLDSSGGSVNDSIALGRRLRSLGALTTVGASMQTQTPQGERAQRGAGSLLRVDVRVPAACRARPDTCRRGACQRASDLDGRSRRRRQGRELYRAGSDDRGARHRSSRQIHLRHGRHRRSAVAGAERAAVGRSARIVARTNCA